LRCQLPSYVQRTDATTDIHFHLRHGGIIIIIIVVVIITVIFIVTVIIVIIITG
jgi:hypothetical protein